MVLIVCQGCGRTWMGNPYMERECSLCGEDGIVVEEVKYSK